MKPKKARQKKVWRIFRFKERFELPDNIRFDSFRRKPLVYIRDYVGSGQDDESVNYKRQITACKTSPNRHKLLAVFSDLREIAAGYSLCFRGYILDERFEPAGINKITGWIGLNSSETCKILKELEQIGLIERVSMPEFDPSLNDLPEDSRGKKSKSRARSSAHEKSRAPLKKRESKTGSGNGKGNRKSFSGKTPEKDKTPEPEKAKPNTTAQAVSEGLRQKQADPMNPKESDAGVGGYKTEIQPNQPRKSFIHQPGQPIRLDMALRRHFNPDASEFAHAIYQAIGTPYVLDSQEGRSEIGCWEVAWLKAQATGINPTYLEGLWNRTMREAAALKRKRNNPRNKWTKSPEAVLRDLFDKFLDKAIQKATQAGQEQLRAISSA